MTYRLIFAPSFEEDVQEKIDWLRGQGAAERVIEAWFVKLYRQLESLTDLPRSYPVDATYTAEVGRESRKISFKDHLVLYQVDETLREVSVIAFVHGATRHT
ncbi:type II toxin-antitoxin system RelE/ParE family toxin [Phycisphaeraceae bacterium D3-23]